LQRRFFVPPPALLPSPSASPSAPTFADHPEAMTLLYFAQARRITGLATEKLPASAPLSEAELWHALLQRHPDLAILHPVIRLARNGEFATPDAVFHPDDEVALIPPVSGG
jgi:molybdopterin converting factor subunit 1